VPSIIPHFEGGTCFYTLTPHDWHLPFEIMCHASDYAVGAVLD
jgi:hypothetical protein